MLRLKSAIRNFPSRLFISIPKSCFLFSLFFLVPWTLNLVPDIGHAADVMIGWDKSPASDIAGYRVHYGTSSGNYDFSVDIGSYDSCSISGLEEGQTYYFAATSINTDNIESEFSEELVHTVPLSGSGGNGDGINTEIVIEAEEMSFHANGAQRATEWLLWSNGTMSEEIDFPDTGIYSFEIAARGDLAHGVGPEMEVFIDGNKKGTVFVNTGTPDIYEFDVEISVGRHNFAIGFNNDFYDPAQGIDRNLYVDKTVIFFSPESGAAKIIEIEAENGSMSYPFESAGDNKASSGTFVWVPNGRGNSWNPNQNSGYIEYTFNVPADGDYVVWGRVLARNGSDNSFFVSVDGGTYSLWDTKKSKSWVWDPVSNRGGSDPVIYHLAAGQHTLTVKQREDGTKLDKILITGDLTYMPE